MQEWLRQAVGKEASDIFIGTGRRIAFKVNGHILPQSETALSAQEARALVGSMYETAARPMDRFLNSGDDDFTISIPGFARFRVCAYKQRNTVAAVVRVIRFEIPEHSAIHIPREVMDVLSENHGLVLVSGPAGSGKTTTLACMIDRVNKTRNCHIITLEDPIEFLHRDQLSLISQREVTTDTGSYISALRASLRQSPDIILLGEMRDHDTIRTAMTAAETGHLIISTLHTLGAVSTIDRIVDVFPPAQQQQIRVELAMQLRVVVSQQLLPKATGGLIPAFEIMRVNNAVRAMIRESKTHQIDGVIQTSSQEGMVGMDQFIYKLYTQGLITADTAAVYSVNAEQMARRIKG